MLQTKSHHVEAAPNYECFVQPHVVILNNVTKTFSD